MPKVEDDFLYPIPVGGEQSPAGDSAAVATATGLRLTNALDAVLSLYQHAGVIPKQRFDPKSSQPTENPTSADSSKSPIVKMDEKLKTPWFKYSERVIPGGLMKLVESITIPTPKGWSTTTVARVNQLFDRRFLVEFESKEILSQFTYTELDELRFAYTAVLDLITGGPEAVAKMSPAGGAVASSTTGGSASSAETAAVPPSYFASQTAQAAATSKIFENMWNLQGLAKRDIKKNCEPSSSTGDAEGGSASAAASASPVVVAGKQKTGVAKGGTGSSGLVRTDASKDRPKLAAEKKHAKALLEDECAKLWPHTPPAKAAAFTLTQDPNQPRHKPLYKATVELANMNKRKIEGPFMGNKKDAEDAAAEVVLKFLYSSAFKK